MPLCYDTYYTAHGRIEQFIVRHLTIRLRLFIIWTIYKRDRYIFFFLLHTALSSVSCFFSYLIHFVIFWRNLSCKLTPLLDKELARLSVRSLNTRVIDHVSNLTTLVVQPLGAMVHLLKHLIESKELVWYTILSNFAARPSFLMNTVIFLSFSFIFE